MNTTRKNTVEENLKVAISYYEAMQAKDFETLASYLSDNIYFISPLAEIRGKEELLMAIKNFGKMLINIQIRSKFSDYNQVMLAYDMTLPKPIDKFRAATLMDFENNKIIRLELFYDARLLEAKKKDVFGNPNN